MLSKGFDASSARGNRATVDTNGTFTITNSVSVRGVHSTAGGGAVRVISVARDLRASGPSGTSWHNASALLDGTLGPPPPPPPPPPRPPVPPALETKGLALRLRAADLIAPAGGLKPGDRCGGRCVRFGVWLRFTYVASVLVKKY
jgi:hypothetical protein